MNDIVQAMAIIMTPEGCGIGRMAHELIRRHNCFVVGVDISPSMRALSVVYTRTNRFMSCSQEMLEGLVARGMRFDVALAIWVLQHCATPAEDAARIKSALKAGGDLFLANGNLRSVPTAEQGWVNDGLDIKAMVNGAFEPVREGRFAREQTTDIIADGTFWSAYKRPAA